MARFANWLLKLWGFTVQGDPANHLTHRIFVVIPHTSNWDFPLGILVRSAHKIRVGFIAKDSLFRPPWGFLFRWMGGYPVDRSKSTRYVDKVVQLFESEPRLAIAIAPEGTRKKVTRLKTGFYHIARLAKVPMILTKFDWQNRVVEFSAPFYASQSEEADFGLIHAHFRGVRGKNPDNGFEPN